MSRMSHRDFLFVGGCVRSGTTALTRVLNAHPNVIVGEERYIQAWGKHKVRPAHFEKDRFLDYQEGDSTRGFYKFRDEADRFGNERYVGDKHPFVFWFYDDFEKHFDDANVVYILRNPVSVCESAQARADDPSDRFHMDGKRALGFWNDSLKRTLDALNKGARIIVVCYEDIFGSRGAISKLFDALKLNPDHADWARIDTLIKRANDVRTKLVPRNDALRLHVSMHGAFSLYRELIDRSLNRMDAAVGTVRT
ncbi:sulfotransferase [Octadecabacter sp.]|nr:sulfotransferase [Octadecabacter sp.]